MNQSKFKSWVIGRVNRAIATCIRMYVVIVIVICVIRRIVILVFEGDKLACLSTGQLIDLACQTTTNIYKILIFLHMEYYDLDRY